MFYKGVEQNLYGNPRKEIVIAESALKGVDEKYSLEYILTVEKDKSIRLRFRDRLKAVNWELLYY